MDGDAATPRDIPVIMSRPMVRATIEDRKTETRRLAWRDKNPPTAFSPHWVETAWQRVKPGDRLYVRESWRPDDYAPEDNARTIFMSLWSISERDCEAEGVVFETADPPFWYVPGIMPNDITAVGIEERADLMPHAVQSFRKLWIYLHGREGWDANPEVVAISFRVINANIDAPEARIAA